MRPILRLPFVCLILLVTVGLAAAEPAYVRQPDVHGGRMVFCAERDLWTANTDGSDCRRLTIHAGDEYFPSYSPDGKLIAFTGQYDGNRDLYVVSADGGEPRRLTWHPGRDEAVGWMPDGKRVIFRSGRNSGPGVQHLYTIDLKGGDAEELPLGWASRLDEDADSGLWVFTRNNRERATWKRYRGGQSTDLWVGHPDRQDYRKITEFAGMDAFPMWHDGRIWFLSDMGGTVNLWSIAPDGTDRVQHTKFDEWDIRWPNMCPDGRIVFTKAADLWIFDPVSDRANKVDVDLSSDLAHTRVRYPTASRNVDGVSIDPSGERLAVCARGEIFSVPVEEGVTLPVTRGTGARERSVSFDPKGEKILYVTDQTGEEEIRTSDAWGRGESEVLKKKRDGVWHYQPLWSPDGKWIAFSDNSYSLFVMSADGGSPHEVDKGTEGEIRAYEWSPDGRWLAYSKRLPSQFSSIFIYDTQEKDVHAVTGPYTDDSSPTWDPDGRYLYFASDRQINSMIGELDFDNIELKNDRLYMVLLREDVENPLLNRAGLPPADEEEEDDSKDEDGKDEEAKEEDEEEKDEDVPDPIEIDFEGLSERFVELPGDMGRYGGLGATSTHLFYFSFPIRGIAETGDFLSQGPPANTLMMYDVAEQEAKAFTEGINGYDLARKGGKIVIRKPGGVFVVGSAAPPGAALAEGSVDLSDMIVELVPREEWAQIYWESWRQMRDFYWDEDMSGVDWDAIGKQYGELLPRLSSRVDLDDLIGQIFGEMNTSHTYVIGGTGDVNIRVGFVPNGLLGADLERTNDEAFQVKRIYRGSDPDRVRSCLDVPGARVKEGEYIVAVNGHPITKGRPFHAWLENLAGKDIVLKVNDKPELKDAREVVVTPMRGEFDLRYADWVRGNREYVLEKTDGKMGYIHVPDMLNPGLMEFNTWFYPQLDREGLVVDMRWNGGGSYSQMMLERLRRRVLSFDFRRGGAVSQYPYRVLNGPWVVLVNESSGSDGDIFPQAVQIEGLAPVIGSRTWGGVNGITSLRPLQDGGIITQSQVAWWDGKDGWDLENRGVIPDIEVIALPQDLARGVDTQLDRGIAEVLRMHRENPPAEPDFGPSMKRARKAYRDELKN